MFWSIWFWIFWFWGVVGVVLGEEGGGVLGFGDFRSHPSPSLPLTSTQKNIDFGTDFWNYFFVVFSLFFFLLFAGKTSLRLPPLSSSLPSPKPPSPSPTTNRARTDKVLTTPVCRPLFLFVSCGCYGVPWRTRWRRSKSAGATTPLMGQT